MILNTLIVYKTNLCFIYQPIQNLFLKVNNWIAVKKAEFVNFTILDKNPLETLLQNLRWQSGCKEAVDQIYQLLYKNEDKWTQMNSYVKQKASNKTQLSSKVEDPQWFQGDWLSISCMKNKIL